MEYSGTLNGESKRTLFGKSLFCTIFGKANISFIINDMDRYCTIYNTQYCKKKKVLKYFLTHPKKAPCLLLFTPKLATVTRKMYFNTKKYIFPLISFITLIS